MLERRAKGCIGIAEQIVEVSLERQEILIPAFPQPGAAGHLPHLVMTPIVEVLVRAVLLERECSQTGQHLPLARAEWGERGRCGLGDHGHACLAFFAVLTAWMIAPCSRWR